MIKNSFENIKVNANMIKFAIIKNTNEIKRKIMVYRVNKIKDDFIREEMVKIIDIKYYFRTINMNIMQGENNRKLNSIVNRCYENISLYKQGFHIKAQIEAQKISSKISKIKLYYEGVISEYPY